MAATYCRRTTSCGKTESTTDYFKVAARISFTDYFNERFYPFYREQQPGTTKESLITSNQPDQYRRLPALVGQDRGGAQSDDIILAPGEIDFFRNTFQSRAQIYPKGGHCGNMAYPDNVEYMVNYFKN